MPNRKISISAAQQIIVHAYNAAIEYVHGFSTAGAPTKATASLTLDEAVAIRIERSTALEDAISRVRELENKLHPKDDKRLLGMSKVILGWVESWKSREAEVARMPLGDAITAEIHPPITQPELLWLCYQLGKLNAVAEATKRRGVARNKRRQEAKQLSRPRLGKSMREAREAKAKLSGWGRK